MPLILPNTFKVRILEMITDESVGPENCVLKLYKNNYTPVTSSNAGNFTEATFTGYSGVELLPANWDQSPGDTTIFTYNTALEFIATAGSQTDSIYGYYIVGESSGDLRWAERFTDGPYAIVNEDDSVNVLARISLTGL